MWSLNAKCHAKLQMELELTFFVFHGIVRALNSLIRFSQLQCADCLSIGTHFHCRSLEFKCWKCYQKWSHSNVQIIIIHSKNRAVGLGRVRWGNVFISDSQQLESNKSESFNFRRQTIDALLHSIEFTDRSNFHAQNILYYFVDKDWHVPKPTIIDTYNLHTNSVRTTFIQWKLESIIWYVTLICMQWHHFRSDSNVHDTIVLPNCVHAPQT